MEGKASAFYTPHGVFNSLTAPYEHFVENEDPIYIQINFREKYENMQYLDVLEDDECSLQTYLDGKIMMKSKISSQNNSSIMHST